MGGKSKNKMKTKTEIYCHECNSYVSFILDKSLNGNHVIVCPKCGHEHCRVVRNGKVTGDRWSSRNQTYYVTNITSSVISNELNYTGTTYLYNSWASTTVATSSVWNAG